MVQIEFWEISNFYCLSRKGETAQEYSREKSLVTMTPWESLGQTRHFPGSTSPGGTTLSSSLPSSLGAEGQLTLHQLMAPCHPFQNN